MKYKALILVLTSRAFRSMEIPVKLLDLMAGKIRFYEFDSS